MCYCIASYTWNAYVNTIASVELGRVPNIASDIVVNIPKSIEFTQKLETLCVMVALPNLTIA